MAAEDPEARLRGRVTHAVARVGAPDRGRLAAIEQRLPVARRRRPRVAPWLAVALLTASAAGATTWWIFDDHASRGSNASATDASETAPPGERRAGDAAPADERDDGGPTQDTDEQRDSPVIYRR